MSMELDHSFTVPVPPDQAWNVLLDVEKIAPCMPGAQVETVDGDDVAGRLKVKVGPVSLTYKGTATFKDRDTADRSVLVEASGKEMRGAGTASATVRAALSPEDSSDSGTLVTLHTTLNVTGRPAQFGRGVIAEVGSRLIDKFADNLAQQLTNGGMAAAAATAGPAAAGPAAAGPAAAAPPVRAPAAASSGPGAASTTPGAPSATPGGTTAGNGASDAPSAAAPAASAPSAAAPAASAPTATAPAAHVPLQTAAEPVQSVPVQHQDDSLDLLSLVGPVVVKRLAPVVGAIAAFALLTWGIRRVIRRRRSA
jgi:carbon monoxide dehydrogenase subunit G